MIIGFVGNPNCGKTTLFNALTGARQRVGNWPGVTVERKIGSVNLPSGTVDVIDLPGIYSLVMSASSSALDEKIACDYILNDQPDLIVNVVDASHLERSLYLTMQLLEMRIPMLIALNMMDAAEQQGIQIDIKKLSALLGCPVVPIQAHKGKGLTQLKKAFISSAQPASLTLRDPHIQNDHLLTQTIHTLSAQIKPFVLPDYQKCIDWLAMRLLENDVFAATCLTQSVQAVVDIAQQNIRKATGEDIDILLADARYRCVGELLSRSVTHHATPKTTWTQRIDRIVLNRVLGIPIFLLMMYSMFLFAINIGGAFQDFFDLASSTLFVDGTTQALHWLGAPNALIAVLANGVGRGINTTVTFIPVIGAMFLFLALLEDSGYMARAAFVVDRVMRAMGLPGKSFVPMIVGFGCNVPAVMAARTLENPRDRILTVMMMPFMSCSARLAIYAVFTAAFFPVGGQNVVFALYLIGILAATLTGLLLRKTLLQGDPAPLVMELPAYHVPHIKTVLLHAWQRLKGFVLRAGKLIVPICLFIGVLGSLKIDGTVSAGDGDLHSWLSAIGQTLTPIFTPMGIHQDNWPATVGLLTGVLAKEVVIGTLNALYSQMGHLADLQAQSVGLLAGLRDAVLTIPHNLSQLGGALSNPVLAVAPMNTLTQGVYGVMYQRFDGQAGAMAYLLFVLLYFPCVSTIAAVARELNTRWALFSVAWTTLVAYSVAVMFYQVTTLLQHPWVSMSWVIGLISFIVLVLRWMRNSVGGAYAQST